MKSIVMEILLNNNLCVLCTCKNNIPNSSLMQYICDPPCKSIYMLTLKESKKYLNIINNTNVSLLIDTRDSINDKTTPITAITIYGEATIVEDKDNSNKLIDQLINKHNNLVKLGLDKNVCVVEISIKSFLLLEGVNKSSYISLAGNG